MIVRYKLDTCGIKLKLTYWHQLSQSQREFLVNAPCDTTADIDQYRQRLQDWVFALTGSPASTLAIAPHPPWLDSERIPPQILAELIRQQSQVEMSLDQWQCLSPLQRFALLKLSQPGHENRNFLAALAEFKPQNTISQIQ